MNCKFSVFSAMVASFALCTTAYSQSPSVIYTWPGTGDVSEWVKNFGTNTVTFDNTISGELTITETGTAGKDVAIRDSFNRVRESSSLTGGLDLTGLDFLEFDLGHNGLGNVDVQFYVQGGPYMSLGPDVAVSPGINTYQVPLTGLPFESQVYIRTVGVSIRDHIAEGNLTWTLQEVRSGGTPLNTRVLVNHNAGASDGGIQGAIANFDRGAIVGNNGGQNQSGLVHNLVDGSLQWTDQGHHDQGDTSGGAVTWANGTAWNGNSFNERTTDVSNYNYVTYRVKATDIAGPFGGTVGFQPFFYAPSFSSGGNFVNLPIDGAYHELTFPMASFAGDFSLTNWTGINLASHTNDIAFDVDFIRFSIPEPGTFVLFGLAAACMCGQRKVRKRLR